MERVVQALKILYDYCTRLSLKDPTIRASLHKYCSYIELELDSGWQHVTNLQSEEKEAITESYRDLRLMIQKLTQAILNSEAELNLQKDILTPLTEMIAASKELQGKLIKLEKRIDLDAKELHDALKFF